ncbi:MAG: DUF4129 domain-containing protein, partial [Roseibium sp.]|uniref:DUF4129 domain-containing protein n=1 Tax=Roseibium sp. TaxID=1936156 RepID=UPI0026211E26
MFRLLILFIFFSVLTPVAQLAAQEAVQEPFEIEDAGNDYLKAIRWRGIDAEVTYFDPSAPPPNLDTNQQPLRSPVQREGTDLSGRWTTGLIAAAILALIVFLFLRFGGGIAVSLKQDAENPGSTRLKRQPKAPAWAEKLGTFDEILRLKDRKQALILLVQKALATTVAAHGVLMQRSWTARDALRHIPNTQHHLDDLRTLVSASERVQFGGRDLSEEEFREHVVRCRKLL